MAKPKATDSYNDLGQDGPAGEPDPKALEIVKKAQEALSSGPAKEAPVTAGPELTKIPEVVNALLAAVRKSPEVATELLKAASSTEEGRELFKPEDNKPRPSGFYNRDFNRESHLHVTGGLEVRHPIDKETGSTKRPLPPAYIKRYVASDGTLTDYRDESERPAGSKIPVAARAADGGPSLTDEYKKWIDLQMKGERMDSSVRSDLQVHGQMVDDGVAQA